VFPEYFTVQLLTLGDVKKKIRDQVRGLARQEPRFIELMKRASQDHGIYIVRGTIPCEVPGEVVRVRNRAHFFSLSGSVGFQDRLHMTRFRNEEWIVSPGTRLKIFETHFGKVAIMICYDVEFSEIARIAARAGATVLMVPSCTDDWQGFLRVRYSHA
jgi:predicted amidohydrolase